jgi:hemerythrin superfamily protein
MTGSVTGRDVVDVLTTDHREVTELIGQIRATSDAEQRRDLTDIAISELVRHSVAEEMYVYPAMKKFLADGEKAVQRDIEEHKQLERIMKELEDADSAGPGFVVLIGELESVLRDHVQDEETEQFPELRAKVPHEELVEIAGKVETAKKLAPTRPHPAAPNNELFHKLVGPGVGMVDRPRDKLTGRSTGDA